MGYHAAMCEWLSRAAESFLDERLAAFQTDAERSRLPTREAAKK
jgi:hypothetical protein